MGLHHGQANFVTYGKPSLFLDFANKKSLTDRISGNNLITFTRSSTGTYVGADGLIKYAGADEARFDHDPVTGESLGLLIEEQRTNLVTYSEDFSLWATQQNSTISLNSIISPDGVNNSQTFTRNNTNNSNYVAQSPIKSSSTNLTYTFTIFAKKSGNGRYFSIRLQGLYPSRADAVFDFDTGNWSISPQSVSNFSNTTGTIESLKDGWYKISVTTLTDTYPAIFYAFSISDISTSRIDGTSNNVQSVYVWGAQLEQASFPTSYIPTSGSTVTRQPDNASITGTNFTDFYNQSEGSFYSDMKLNPSFPVSGKVSISFTLSDNSYNNRITLGSSTGSSALNADVNISGTVYRAVIGNYTSGSSSIRTSIGYKSADTAGSFDGASPVTSSPSGTLPLLTRADIGKDHTDFNHLSGHIRRITYYPQRLTNTQLQSLTS
jgi:hypothetical protein